MFNIHTIRGVVGYLSLFVAIFGFYVLFSSWQAMDLQFMWFGIALASIASSVSLLSLKEQKVAQKQPIHAELLHRNSH